MGRSIKRAPFAATVSRVQRRAAGRTWAPGTPLAVRTSGLAIPPNLRARVPLNLGRRLGKFAPHLERLTVRFEDVNGPRGGLGVVCRIKAVVSGLPSLVVAELARTPARAFDRASQGIERAVRRALSRAREDSHLGRLRLPAQPPADTGQSAPRGTTPSRRSISAPARNRKGRAPKATVALEGSLQARPSRKSTRGSANRAKHGNKMAQRERQRAVAPNARRAQAARSR